MRWLALLLVFYGCNKPAPVGVELDGVRYVPGMMVKVAEIEGKPVFAPGYITVSDYESMEDEVRRDVSKIMWVTEDDNYSEVLR